MHSNRETGERIRSPVSLFPLPVPVRRVRYGATPTLWRGGLTDMSANLTLNSWSAGACPVSGTEAKRMGPPDAMPANPMALQARPGDHDHPARRACSSSTARVMTSTGGCSPVQSSSDLAP